MFTYIVFKLGSLLIPWVPEGIGFSVARLLGDLSYLLLRRQRKAVLANLRRVLGPAAAPRVLRHTARQVFRHVVLNYYDLLRLPRVDPSRLEKRVTLRHLPYFEKERNKGRGVVLVTAHLGNCSLIAPVLGARSISALVLSEPLHPPRLSALVGRLRARSGVQFSPVGLGTLRAAVRTLKQGGVVALTCDRDLQGKGDRCTLFGEQTHLPTGAIELALRTGASVVPAFVFRRAHGRYEVMIDPPVSLDTHASYPQAVQAGLIQLAAVMERHIGAHPEQWVVLQPVWGSQSNAEVEQTPGPSATPIPWSGRKAVLESAGRSSRHR